MPPLNSNSLQDLERQKFVESPDSTQTSVAATLINRGGVPSVTSVSVGTSSISVLSANTARKLLVFTNNSANIVYLNLAGGTATTANTYLAVSGGQLVLDTIVPTSAITAIASGASSTLSVTEM